MSIQIKNEYGAIEISNEAIATVVGNATTECYGVVGMASKNFVKDGLATILGKENYSKGVTLSVNEDHKLIIDLYVVVGMNLKISEVSCEIQKKVRYVTESIFGKHIQSVNVFVQGIKGSEE